MCQAHGLAARDTRRGGETTLMFQAAEGAGRSAKGHLWVAARWTRDACAPGLGGSMRAVELLRQESVELLRPPEPGPETASGVCVNH